MIDIIIPAYNAHKTIEKTLLSIAYQENIKDIKVYIVNDASKKDYSKEVIFFKNFMNIKELKLSKNGGPGVARQYGIDNSNSTYIVFIDSDDVFASPTAIKILYNNIKETKSDVVISSFYEILDDGSIDMHEEDSIWLHGKIYRRKFLEKNNIRFNNTRANEDNGFNQCVFLHSPKLKVIEDCTYFWLYNEKSITRKNNHRYKFTSIEKYIYNITWALNKAIKDNCDSNEIAELAFSVLVAVYFYYIEFFDETSKEGFVKKAKKLYQIHLKYNLEEERKNELFHEQYLYQSQDMEDVNVTNPPITFENFLKLIEGVK